MRLPLYKLCTFIATLLVASLSTIPLYSQITGSKFIPGDYSTVSAAVTALNTAGVGTGGVVFNIAAGYTETISTTISLAATGTAANPITFRKDPATVGTNPTIIAYTGGVGTPATAVQDGIFRLIGSDYVTIDGINVKDNASNTTNPSTMEYGFALYKAGTSNGCQNVTIQNCVITLNRVNNAAGTAPMVDGSTGIVIMNALATAAVTVMTPVSSAGTNSNNKLYGNIIQNCNTGIAIIGFGAASPFTLADSGNDIGGSSISTGNTIINFGGGSGATVAAVAVRTLAQYGLNVAYNSISSNNGSGANHPTTIRGIYINSATSATSTVSYNTITLVCGGTTQNMVGIENASGSTAAANTVTISNNTVTNCSYPSATTGGFYGILNSASPALLSINGNIISDNSSAATTTGFLHGIYNSGVATTVSIRGNTVSGNSTAALTTGLFTGIINAAAAPTVAISGNSFSGNTTSALSGVHYPIYNSAAVITTLNIDSNTLGTSVSPCITFSAANSGAQIFINNTGGAGTAALNIRNNSIQNINYAVTGSGTNTYISNTAATKSQTITGNNFVNLNVNLTGSITFIANSVVVPATGTQDVNSNSISGTFTKAAGGTVTLFTSAASSVSGAIINNNSNNFSNITVTGATVIAGWVNTDAGSPTKTIQNNTFSNWTGGTGNITAMSVNVTATGNSTTGNLINNIACACTITGITTGAGNDNIYGNTINTLTTTAALGVIGISITSGTVKNVYANKLYDLQASIAGGTVYGISVSGTTSAVITANIHNNLIGDLRTPAASAADPIRGLSITTTRATSTINVYYNTIYLNASSTGTNFGTTGIYHTVSTTSTTATLNLRNNIIANYSVPNGTGITVAYRRSGTSFSNYASTSNNNLLYAGTPASNRLLFYNGTNSDQTIATYKARVTPIDVASISEDLSANFTSTSGASAAFLHLNPAVPTQAESGGANITNFTTDVDGNIRQGNGGYSGSGTLPDIGADEFNGTKALPLSGTYTIGTGGNYTSLTKAGGLFAAINSLGLSGDVDISIISDLAEDGSNILNQWTEQGVGNYALTIEPNSTTIRTISGNVAGALIKLNGADRVTIDGHFNNAGNYLTFRNTNTAGATGTSLTLIEGATNNTFTNCTFEAYANATNGVILFGTSSVAGGNSNNQISNCNINATVTGNTGNVCIYSAGTATAGFENSSNTLSANNIYNYRDRGIDITASGSTSWTISGNSLYNGSVTGSINYAAASTLHGIRILGGSGYTVSNNYIGGSTSQATGSAASYSTTLGLLTYWGILLTTTSATPASLLKGNTVANLSIAAVPNSTGASGSNVFHGIETNGSGITIGGSLAGEGNTVGSNTANGSILITTTTALTTHRSNIRGIYCASTGGTIIGNLVGGFDIKNIGAGPAASTFSGIYVAAATAPSQINNNIIGSTGVGASSNSIRVPTTSTSVSTSLVGINLTSTITSAVQVDGNTVQNLSNLYTGNTAGGITGISNAAAGTASIAITNNTVSNHHVAAYTTGLFYGISNSGAATSVNISNNTLAGSSSASATGVYNAIVNTGAVTGPITINNNNIGTSGSPAFTFNVASSASEIFISNSAGAASSALSISNNIFQNISYPIASTGTNTYISNSAATLSQAINGNTFTNLNVNTSGNITFISNSVIVGATGIQNVNNNSILGTFTKRAGGTLTLFTSSATSVAGGIINNIGNNFSNITVTGATVIAGWVNTDAGAASKTIQNNIFSTWSGGTGAITVINVNLTNATNATSGNTISNISNGAAITGIATAAGNDNIYSNTISGLSCSAAAAVTAISITAGTTKNIHHNKIYDLQAGSTTGSVNGILVSGATVVTTNIYNNIIGDLRVPAASSTTDLIRAISITSTTTSSTNNVYFNSIYLNATSTGTNFSTTGIYHTANATATTATLNLRNNSITNTSTPKGTGLTVAIRRSANTPGNFANTSNNNLLYAGVPGTTKLIFYDGTNSDQTLTTYKARVIPRDSVSVTEDLTAKFLSTTGSSSVFLHMSTTSPSLVESGAINIAGYNDDFDGQIRQGNPGYTGSGYAPDIGADEVFGIEAIPPVINYTLLSNTTSTTNRVLSGVTITDASGINITSGTKPRIYFKRFRDANTYIDNTANTNGWKYVEAGNSTSPFSFTIDYSLLYGGTVTAGEIQYLVVAQDLATIANVGINSGTFAITPASVALTASAFPVSGTINSFDIPYSGTYTVGATEVLTSLTRVDGLFGSINRVGLSGNTTIRITSDLSEDGYYALNQWTETGLGNYKLTIVPDAGTSRIISGDALGGLIRLDGADRVIIDGSFGGSGQYLTFRNTNAAGTTGTAVTFINGASADTIKYCNAQAYADASHGAVYFGISSAIGGNSNNLIDNCNILATVSSNTGNTGLYSGGTATAGYENSNNTISNSNVYNYRDRGIDISASGSTGWTIIGNSIYNGGITGAINYTGGTTLHGIRILGGAGYNVLNNYIGGSSALTTGANASYNSSAGNLSFEGIALTTSSASPLSNIKGNRISRISISSAPTLAGGNCFTGITSANAGINIGGTGSNEGNVIGSNTTNGSISLTTTTGLTTYTTFVYGIRCTSTGGLIAGNQVGGFDINNAGAAPAASTLYGIYVNSASAPSPIKLNTIGSTGVGAASNSIRVRSFSLALNTAIYGISLGSAVASPILVDSNTIQNLSNTSTTSSGTFRGISGAAAVSAAISITNNSVKNISTGANASGSSGIYAAIESSGAATITSNTIDNIVQLCTGTAAQILGIMVAGNNSCTISGNTISNLSSPSTMAANSETGLPSAFTVVGILSTNSGPLQVSGNTISNLASTSVTATNTAVTGIGIESGTGDIYRNRLFNFTNTANGTTTLPGLNGISAAGSAVLNVYNNVVQIDNSFNSNGVKIYGMNHNSASNCNYYYNTISIAGNASLSATRTAAFIRASGSTLLLRNNVLLNTRSGAGSHFAISNIQGISNWPGSSANYNNIYSSNAATTGEWGTGNSKTFPQWVSASGSGSNSVNRAVTFITATYDLEPSNLSNCGLDNSASPVSTPISISTDINNNARNVTSPDMGAYEFSYTPFIVSANSDAPICAGSNVSLAADPGNAVGPTYSWLSPNNSVVSTSQNPSTTAFAGRFKVIVTDAGGCIVMDSTLVTLLPRPTATLSGPGSVCDGSSLNIMLSVAGTGTISGTLNSGDNFSGTAPQITVNVTPTATTGFYIVSMSDANCTSIPSDIPDTLQVIVQQAGLWSGLVSTNWNHPGNWLCGSVPDSTVNILLPSGLNYYPVISSGTIIANDLTLQTGASLNINGGNFKIGGVISGTGSIAAVGGTITMEGNVAQSIPASIFSGRTLNNLTIDNTAGVSLSDTLKVKGILLATTGTLNSAGKLVLLSTATQTALIDGSGSGSVSGLVTMQRYLPSGYGYRYLSSPFQAATVAQLANDVNLGASFPSLYRYDENLATAGWVNYTATNGLLNPLQGYAVNCGSANSAKTIDMSGVVNNGTVNSATLYNHNNTYTLGFNLAGNPYPSPIDWNAVNGWTKTNIDNAVYYFNPSSTDQYTGTYTTYINGISSDGIANNIIPSMQAFFVHVSNGSYPVVASLSVNNAARVTNLNPVFHKQLSEDRPLVRIRARFEGDTLASDHTAVYFEPDASAAFEEGKDALKLNNTDDRIPSLYAVSDDNMRLSIAGITTPDDNTTTVPLGLNMGRGGWIVLDAPTLARMPSALNVFLADAGTNTITKLLDSNKYRVFLDKGNHEHRFYLIFSRSDRVSMPGGEAEVQAYVSGKSVFVYVPGEQGEARIMNSVGQVIAKESFMGKGYHEIKMVGAAGVYMVHLDGMRARKVFIGE